MQVEKACRRYAVLKSKSKGMEEKVCRLDVQKLVF